MEHNELERSNEGKHLIRVGNLPSPSIHHLYSSESSMELRHKNLKNVQYVYRSNLSKSFAHIRSQSRGEVSDPTNIIHSMKPRSQQKNQINDESIDYFTSKIASFYRSVADPHRLHQIKRRSRTCEYDASKLKTETRSLTVASENCSSMARDPTKSHSARLPPLHASRAQKPKIGWKKRRNRGKGSRFLPPPVFRYPNRESNGSGIGGKKRKGLGGFDEIEGRTEMEGAA